MNHKMPNTLKPQLTLTVKASSYGRVNFARTNWTRAQHKQVNRTGTP